MTIANDIISHRVPDFEAVKRAGETLDDIDEYGFTPLIECAITRQAHIAEMLIERGIDINKPDVTGRTALHWAVDNEDLKLTRLLLENGANPNAYTSSGMPVLVYPVLRGQDNLKQLLYQFGAKLDFAQDFIYAKLIGHRFELQGNTDIVNAEGEFIVVDYEGFILEFTVAIVKDSLRRFMSSFSTRHLRQHFPYLQNVMDAFSTADELLTFQHHVHITDEDQKQLAELIKEPMLFLPAASRGHAMGFIRYGAWWAKIDRGENSLKEGSINIYKTTKPQVFNVPFLQTFLYQKQPREFFHQAINQQLGLERIAQLPMSSQISGNCSWANVQASIPVGFSLQCYKKEQHFNFDESKELFETWVEWDQDRALDECIQRFYLADKVRRASIASMLGAVLFQSCDYTKEIDMRRAEKMLTILTLPDYYYVLKSYLDIYCVKQLTRKGNNLLKILDDCGVNPNIGVTPIATGLKPREER